METPAIAHISCSQKPIMTGKITNDVFKMSFELGIVPLW